MTPRATTKRHCEYLLQKILLSWSQFNYYSKQSPTKRFYSRYPAKHWTLISEVLLDIIGQNPADLLVTGNLNAWDLFRWKNRIMTWESTCSYDFSQFITDPNNIDYITHFMESKSIIFFMQILGIKWTTQPPLACILRYGLVVIISQHLRNSTKKLSSHHYMYG